MRRVYGDLAVRPVYAPAMPVLEGRDLVKRYGERTALDDVSFSVAAGECVAIAGPNGAGKTTLLSLLSGVVEPDAGSVDLRSIRSSVNGSGSCSVDSPTRA